MPIIVALGKGVLRQKEHEFENLSRQLRDTALD
jgi:hypothetical protein